MKLWSKDNSTTAEMVENFTVGRDLEFDMLLAKYDVQGNVAHAQMLAAQGILTHVELKAIEKELEIIAEQIEAGSFQIEAGIEDVHSQIEFLLTKKLGDIGKKIHTGRSRNDQVAVDIKLFLQAECLAIQEKSFELFEILMGLAKKHETVLLPGYTHLQIAMPSSFGLWFSAWAESLVDDLDMLGTAYRFCSKNPLGSGAGYGSSFPLNRTMTTDLLHFDDLHYNTVYAQMSRGKTEKTVAIACATIASTLARMCMDICLYLSQNFAFISFPTSLTTGSSIMPHKKNPDIFELARAKCNRLQAIPNELALLLTNLPSGYHRDVQLTKEILFPALQELKACLDILIFALPQIEVRKDILNDPKYAYLFSVDAVAALVQKGQSFREAYQQIGAEIEAGTFDFLEKNCVPHTHEGSMGNLCLGQIREAMDMVLQRW